MSNILKTHLYENSKIKNKINTIHTIEALNFDYFVAELPKGPYCSKHTILNDNEIEVVLNDVKCVKKNLPRIPVSDPMIVWLGGKPGNVVKIESVSDTVGMSITYRLVTP